MKQGTSRPADAVSPERELILCCARARIDPAAKDRVRALLSNGVNWSEVVANAIQHRVSAVVYESITEGAQDLISLSQQQMLRDTAHLSSTNGMTLLGELLRLHRVFEEAQIPVVPYKGPVLAWLGYGSFIRREYIDLDFALPQQYIPQATEALRATGYSLSFDPREAHAGQSGVAPGQYSFVLSKRNIQVELHTERTLRYFPVPLDFKDLARRLIGIEISGHRLRTFSIEDTLVILSVHGTKHFWERLAWILDIAQVISVQEVDWTLLMAIAKGMQSTRVLLLGLYLAHDLIGASLPPSVLQSALRDKQVQWLAARVTEKFAAISDPGAGVWPRAIFRLRSSDTINRGLRHMCRLMMSPTESDRALVRLPGFLTPAYPLIRLWRLLREYGLGLDLQSKPDLAIYQSTPPEIVNHMLRLAGISSEDVLYDLGCGDGRIVVAAAEKYGIHAIGVDINPKRIAEARLNARRCGVKHLVQFRQGDAKALNVSEATVVTMFLGADSNLRLVEHLRSNLQPGARIVSRNFQIYGWLPDRVETHELPDGIQTDLYLWTIKKREGQTPAAESPMHEWLPSHKNEV